MRRLIVLAVILTAVLPSWSAPAGAVSSSVIIAAVEADTYLSGEADEAVVLKNQGDSDVDVGGWTLQDSTSGACSSAEGVLRFPSGAVIPAGATWVVTGNASAWRLDRPGSADWEWLADSDPAVPQLTRACGRFVLANGADEVLLVDGSGGVVDAVVYGGAARAVSGWSGDPLATPTKGLVLERDRPELGGALPDSDSAADWDDLRVTRIGQSHWGLETFTDAASVTTCASPDSSFATVEAFVRGTQSTLDVELYEWTNAHLVDAFTDVLDDGKRVRLLVEGGPVGLAEEDRHQQNWILDALSDAGADVRFMITNASQNVHDRYSYLHQKIAIRDGTHVLVMSGNWKDSGLPTDPTYGNREWCVVVESPGLAAYLTRVFEDDSSLGYRDVIRFGTGTDWRYLPPPPDFEPDMSIPVGGYPPLFPSERHTATAITPVMTPDTSLLVEDPAALIPRIRAATVEVLVEQMTLNKHWGPACCGSPESDPSPLLEAVIAAARNGARVRVLLGGEFIEANDTRNNRETVAYLRGIAENESLDMKAGIVDTEIAEFTKIHNKGVVIDRETAYVGSMNWGRGSAQENREIGLLIDSVGAAEYYRELFWYDWNPPEFKPLTNLRADAATVVHDAPALPPNVPNGVPALPEADPANASLTPTRLVVTVTNTGTRGASDHDVEVTVTDASGQSAVFVKRVPHVRAGETIAVEFPWEPFVAVGTFSVSAKVDVLDEVRELDETDNAVAGTGTVLVDVPGAWYEWDVDAGVPTTLP